MVTFGDEDNMVERFVEIDARVFLDGTLTSRRVFQLTGPGTRENLGFPGNLHVFTEGLSVFGPLYVYLCNSEKLQKFVFHPAPLGLGCGGHGRGMP